MKFYTWLFLSFAMLWPGLMLAEPATLALQLLEESDPTASYAALAASRTLGTIESQRLPQGPKAFAWYRVQLLKGPQEPVLVLRNSLGARVRLLLADGTEQRQRRGTWPVEQPQFSQFNLVFDLPAVRAGESVFLGVANAPAQAILLGLYERADYLALDANSIRLLSACLGILLAFATLGLVFFAAERDHISLVFACSLLLQFVYFGFMFGEAAYWPVLGRLWPHWVEICVLALGFSTIFLSEVYARLIDLPQRMPRLMLCIRLLYLWSGAIVLVTLLDWLTRSGTRSEWAAQASFSGNFLIVIVPLESLAAFDREPLDDTQKRRLAQWEAGELPSTQEARRARVRDALREQGLWYGLPALIGTVVLVLVWRFIVLRRTFSVSAKRALFVVLGTLAWAPAPMPMLPVTTVGATLFWPVPFFLILLFPMWIVTGTILVPSVVALVLWVISRRLIRGEPRDRP